jgi:transcription-repair coupling factor (superfamily II helicase)
LEQAPAGGVAGWEARACAQDGVSMNWLDRIATSQAVGDLGSRLGTAPSVSARGVVGSSTVLMAAALVRSAPGPILIVTPHLDDADEASDELEGLGVDVARLPVMELVPGETSVNLELLAERLSLIRRLADGAKPEVITAPIQSLMQAAPDAGRLDDLLRIHTPGDRVDMTELTHWLDRTGYRRVPAIETIGEFSVRGGIIDLFPAGGEPTRIDLFGDEIDSIHAIDLDTMGSDRKLDSIQLVGATLEQVQTDRGSVPFADYLPEGSSAILCEMMELTEQGRSYFDRVADAGGIYGPPAVFQSLQKRCVTVMDVNQFSPGAGPGDLVEAPVRGLPPFDESASKAVEELLELAGECDTIVLCQNEGEQRRFGELLADVEGGDRLASEVRYLHRGLIWDDGEAERPLALVPYHELLHRYHTRRRIRRIAGGRAVDAFIDLQPGDYVVHRDHDTTWQREFEAEFPYRRPRTSSRRSRRSSGHDAARPMDRLLCGDVGFGKTEVAIRAAFKASSTASRSRCSCRRPSSPSSTTRPSASASADYPFRSRALSASARRRSRQGDRSQQEAGARSTSSSARTGCCQGRAVRRPRARDHRRGAALRRRAQGAAAQLRATVDVLTLSATPIPRTLHMSMLGLRDISSLTTPPLDRRAIVTEVIPYNETAHREARDRARAGPRGAGLLRPQPRARHPQPSPTTCSGSRRRRSVVVGHGQMPTSELERGDAPFMRREADILVCTTIIESGIDIPTANTMIINDADRFGLAELHQLRGRVGRYKHRAYCYLLLPEGPHRQGDGRPPAQGARAVLRCWAPASDRDARPRDPRRGQPARGRAVRAHRRRRLRDVLPAARAGGDSLIPVLRRRLGSKPDAKLAPVEASAR